jgi:hypothetical protein
VVHVFTNNVSIGSNVTSDESPGPVKIKKGGGLKIDSNGAVIENEFSVESGGILEIK